MRLIIGLGNPGEKYANTRHNIGYMVMDDIAKVKEVEFASIGQFEADIAEVGESDKIFLVKPLTFMNNSGNAAQKLKNFYKVDVQDVLIVHDDVDLEMGKIRLSFSGSSAGHKGVQSIIDKIGEDFWRLRIGVGKDGQIPTDAWVLQNFEKDEKLKTIIDKATGIVIESLSKEINKVTINI
jgi:peptidyl-tRNA hydrolase, PTH1 family